jgi:signal transduction histidine kinase
MVSNSLVAPGLLRRGARYVGRRGVGGLVLAVRRVTIVVVVLLGYAYFRLAGEAFALVSIGLVSFAAVAQFAPALLGGVYWRGGSRRGALAGLVGGFAVWAYTLPLPTLVRAGWLSPDLLDRGPWGIGLLRPERLFGLDNMDPITQSMVWSMLVNVGCYVGVSLLGRRSPAEYAQAASFADALRQPAGGAGARLWRGRAQVADLGGLLERYLGPDAAREALQPYLSRHGLTRLPDVGPADVDLIEHVETVLASAVGTASARVLVASVVDEEPLGVDEVIQILDEASQVRAYSRELERKSRQLEAATAELRAANERLRELDRLKDDFVSTVTHELRTPLTSIRAFSEILLDNPDLAVADRQRYLEIVAAETARLTRLINQVLDLAKIESGTAEWRIGAVDLGSLVRDAAAEAAQLFAGKGACLEVQVPAAVPPVAADADWVVQVLLNLLANAAKFCDPERGWVRVEVRVADSVARVDVQDNGPGIGPGPQAVIFERFRQGGDAAAGRPAGTGLGLPISREIVERMGGRLWVESVPGQGATFSFTLPLSGTPDGPGAES